MSRPAGAEDLKTDIDLDGENLTPRALHQFKTKRSILCLLVADETLYAGTQSGHLLAFVLHTFEQTNSVKAHDTAVLGAHLSSDRSVLLTSGSDRYVNVSEKSQNSDEET